MCNFVILLLSNEMQMSVRRFSAIPHLRGIFIPNLSSVRINKFFEVDFAIKVNASNERRFDRSTVIFKFCAERVALFVELWLQKSNKKHLKN